MTSLNSNFSPFPELIGERVVLTKLTQIDAPSIFALRTDTKVIKYIKRSKYKSVKEAESFIQKIDHGIKTGINILWGIRSKETDVLMGTICFWNFSSSEPKAEIGYELRSEFHGRGLMSESLELVLDFAFANMNARSIEAFTHEENIPSIKLLSQFGFKLQRGRQDLDVPTNVVFILTKN